MQQNGLRILFLLVIVCYLLESNKFVKYTLLYYITETDISLVNVCLSIDLASSITFSSLFQ